MKTYKSLFLTFLLIFNITYNSTEMYAKGVEYENFKNATATATTTTLSTAEMSDLICELAESEKFEDMAKTSVNIVTVSTYNRVGMSEEKFEENAALLEKTLEAKSFNEMSIKEKHEVGDMLGYQNGFQVEETLNKLSKSIQALNTAHPKLSQLDAADREYVVDVALEQSGFVDRAVKNNEACMKNCGKQLATCETVGWVVYGVLVGILSICFIAWAISLIGTAGSTLVLLAPATIACYSGAAAALGLETLSNVCANNNTACIATCDF